MIRDPAPIPVPSGTKSGGRSLAAWAACLTIAEGMFGLLGLTVIVRPDGEITSSRSSIGTAPMSTDSPMTSAPVKQARFSNPMRTGPT